MEIRFLIDSNALIDYLAELMPTNGLEFMDSILDSGDVIMSVITQIEVLGFQAPEEYLQKCQRLIAIAEVIPLVNPAIIDRAILVRREIKIKLPDAVIAATALIRNLTVISRNEKDFNRVKGLTCVNPHEL